MFLRFLLSLFLFQAGKSYEELKRELGANNVELTKVEVRLKLKVEKYVYYI